MGDARVVARIGLPGAYGCSRGIELVGDCLCRLGVGGGGRGSCPATFGLRLGWLGRVRSSVAVGRGSSGPCSALDRHGADQLGCGGSPRESAR